MSYVPGDQSGTHWLKIGATIAIVGVVVAGVLVGGLFKGNASSATTEKKHDALRRQANELFLKARSLKDGQAVWNQSVDAYRQLVELNDQDCESWFRLGYSLHMLRRLDEAIEAFEQASQFEPGRLISLYNIACAYALQGNEQQALDQLEVAIEAGFRCQQLENDVDWSGLFDSERFQELALAARPLGQSPVYRQLDFWVGRWAVYSETSGDRIGTDTVSISQNGFLLEEEWTGNDNSTGRSQNFYDPGIERWVHQWIDDSGSVSRFEGEWNGATMQFEGECVSPDGTRVRIRMTFTPRPDRTIHQLIEEFDEDRGTWNPALNVLYLPLSLSLPADSDRHSAIGCLRNPAGHPLVAPPESDKLESRCS